MHSDPPEVLDEGSELTPEVELRQWSSGATQHRQRVDRALVDWVPELSRNYLQQLILAGAVQINGRAPSKVSTPLKVGDQVSLELRPTAQSQAFTPEVMPLDVVFEDDHLLVLNKPAGLVVHPAPGNWSATLLNGLLARDAQAKFLPRAGIVHRLDKDTSGLMVIARTRACMDALVNLIAAHAVQRHYLALAHGCWRGAARQRADWAIGRDPRNRLRMAVVDLSQHSGKPASTDIELLENASAGCWVHCRLHTGRTHQIRVHMAQLGHPLVADSLYGGAPGVGMQRQALHAYRLAFIHPITAQALSFERPPPADMLAALSLWGLGYNAPTPRS